MDLQSWIIWIILGDLVADETQTSQIVGCVLQVDPYLPLSWVLPLVGHIACQVLTVCCKMIDWFSKNRIGIFCLYRDT